MNKQNQLKQACQYIINSIIRNRPRDKQQCIKQNTKSQIYSTQQIMINLDQQSSDFLVFFSDPAHQRHWLGIIHEHINQERQFITMQQFIHYLLEEDNNFSYENTKLQRPITLPDVKFLQYQFYQGTPKFALLIITFQAINEQIHIFIVRNFHGQVIFLSLNPFHEKKCDIIEKFSHNFESPFLIVFDIIDEHLSPDSQITKQQFQRLSQKVYIAYFKRKQASQRFQAIQRERAHYYQKFNSIFSQEYNKQNALNLSQIEKNNVTQSLLQYHQALARQETRRLLMINWQQPALVKFVLKINFERKIQKAVKQQKDLINFTDFIHSQVLFYQHMQAELAFSNNRHQLKPLETTQNCRLCSQKGTIHSETNFKCEACSLFNGYNIALCQKCFQPYHFQLNILFNTSKKELSISGGQKDHILDLNISNLHAKMNTCQLTDKNQNQSCQKQEKKNQKKIKKQKFPQLSQADKHKVMQLEASASKLIELIGGLKNSQRFYKPKHQNASSEKQFQEELINQTEYMKAIDKIMIRELDMFQNQVFLKIHENKQCQKRPKFYNKHSNIDQKRQALQKGVLNSYMDIEESNQQKQYFCLE